VLSRYKVSDSDNFSRLTAENALAEYGNSLNTNPHKQDQRRYFEA